MTTPESIELAAEVVASFVSNNSLPRNELPALIQAVHSAVERLGKGQSVPPQVEAKAPAVPVRKKRFKSMRRHLQLLGLTPEQYRKKWNLPSDYPMVAPNYATQRSAMAKKIGLGQKRKKAG